MVDLLTKTCPICRQEFLQTHYNQKFCKGETRKTIEQYNLTLNPAYKKHKTYIHALWVKRNRDRIKLHILRYKQKNYRKHNRYKREWYHKNKKLKGGESAVKGHV